MAKCRSGRSTKSGKSNWQKLNEKRRLERQLARHVAFSKSPKRICGKTNPVAVEVQALRRFRMEGTHKKVDVRKVAVAELWIHSRWSFGLHCILVPAVWAPPLLHDDAEAELC